MVCINAAGNMILPMHIDIMVCINAAGNMILSMHNGLYLWFISHYIFILHYEKQVQEVALFFKNLFRTCQLLLNKKRNKKCYIPHGNYRHTKVCCLTWKNQSYQFKQLCMVRFFVFVVFSIVNRTSIWLRSVIL